MGATASIGAIASIVGAAGSAASAGLAISNAVSGGPKPPPTPLMPDQTTLDQAQQLDAARKASLRQGRASTILSSGSSGGGSSTLGP